MSSPSPKYFSRPYGSVIKFLLLKSKILMKGDSVDKPREEVLEAIVRHCDLGDSLMKVYIAQYKWEDSREAMFSVAISLYETGIQACYELAGLTGSESWAGKLCFLQRPSRPIPSNIHCQTSVQRNMQAYRPPFWKWKAG